MIDFGFSEEQNAFRKSVRDYAERELAPHYLARARSGEFRRDVYGEMAGLGLVGLMFPPEDGGGGADAVTVGVAAEELARADFNLSYLTLMGAMAAVVLSDRLPAGHVREEVVSGIIAGEKVFALALTEPEAGSDPAAMRTRARRDGDEWILTGEKTSVSSVGDADEILVFAKTDPDAGHQGISAFLVPSTAPGIARQSFDDHGFRPMGRGAVAFDDVVVPSDRLVGDEGGAFKMVMNTFDFTRALIGLTCVAAASAAIEQAIDYAKQRKTFGRPIANYQGVAFPLVEHATQLEAARWLCYRTLWLRDAGERHTKEAAMCKWWCPKIARDALNDCLLTYGHVAYSEEHPVGQQLLDVMGTQIGDGTAQIQKLIIAREMFGREFAPI